MRRWVKKGTIVGVGGGPGMSNFVSKVRLEVAQSVVGDFGRFLISTGTIITQAPSRLLISQQVGVSLAQLISGVANQAPQNVGVVLMQKNTGSTTPPVSVGAELVQMVTSLVQTTYSILAAATGSWTNPNNGTGANNGSFATNANTLTAAASGSVTYSFASQFNKSELTISSVQLALFWRETAGLTGPGTWKSEYSLDGTTFTQISTGATAFDFSVTPQTLDLTTLVGQDWNKLTNLKVRFTFTAAASVTPSTLSVDAVRLTVNASRVDLL